jgi:hypothetical protein
MVCIHTFRQSYSFAGEVIAGTLRTVYETNRAIITVCMHAHTFVYHAGACE